VDSDPSRTGLAGGEGDCVVEGSACAEGLFGVAVETIAECAGAVAEGLEGACSSGEVGS
jgi:hypothetical protein